MKRDLMKWLGYSFQDFLNFECWRLDFLHDYYLGVLCLVVTVVGLSIFFLVTFRFYSSVVMERWDLEVVWTCLPGAVLLFLGISSMEVLFRLEVGDLDLLLTLQVIGHQWYWEYCLGGNRFDSYLVPEVRLIDGDFRLLEVDHFVSLGTGLGIRAICTSADVIHSWAVPSLGIKVDCIPGRLNQFIFSSFFPGLMYGQCRELCGAGHSFMPVGLFFSN